MPRNLVHFSASLVRLSFENLHLLPRSLLYLSVHKFVGDSDITLDLPPSLQTLLVHCSDSIKDFDQLPSTLRQLEVKVKAYISHLHKLPKTIASVHLRLEASTPNFSLSQVPSSVTDLTVITPLDQTWCDFRALPSSITKITVQPKSTSFSPGCLATLPPTVHSITVFGINGGTAVAIQLAGALQQTATLAKLELKQCEVPPLALIRLPPSLKILSICDCPKIQLEHAQHVSAKFPRVEVWYDGQKVRV